MTLTSVVESYWLIQNKMDKVELPKIFDGINALAKKQDEMVDYIDDYNLEDVKKKSLNTLSKKIDTYNKGLSNTNFGK